MKKIGLLIACTIVLSGCSPSNGILNEKDVSAYSYEEIKPLLEEQENISYTPDDVKLFIEELKKTSSELETKDRYNYITMVLQDINRFEGINFAYDTGVGIYSEKYSKEEFKYLVNALDKTIAKGIKLYLDKNGDVKIDGTAKNTKIGRVWINIRTPEPDPYMENHPNWESIEEGISNAKPVNNNINLRIQIKDIKDEKYKKIVDSLITDDLALDSIRIGKEKNLISLNNIEFINGEDSKKQKLMINYELFVDEDEIEKVRISIISLKNSNITDQDLKLLGKLSSKFDFKNGDIKILEDIRANIKDGKSGKFTKSSDRFSFKYSSREDKSYEFTRNMTEIVIEKK